MLSLANLPYVQPLRLPHSSLSCATFFGPACSLVHTTAVKPRSKSVPTVKTFSLGRRLGKKSFSHLKSYEPNEVCRPPQPSVTRKVLEVVNLVNLAERGRPRTRGVLAALLPPAHSLSLRPWLAWNADEPDPMPQVANLLERRTMLRARVNLWKRPAFALPGNAV